MAYRNAPLNGLSVTQMKLIVSARNKPGIHAYYPASHESSQAPIICHPPVNLNGDTHKMMTVFYAELSEPPVKVAFTNLLLNGGNYMIAQFGKHFEQVFFIHSTSHVSYHRGPDYGNGFYVLEWYIKNTTQIIRCNGKDLKSNPLMKDDPKIASISSCHSKQEGHLQLWELHETAEVTKWFYISSGARCLPFLNQYLVPGSFAILSLVQFHLFIMGIKYENITLFQSKESVALKCFIHIFGMVFQDSKFTTPAGLKKTNIFRIDKFQSLTPAIYLDLTITAVAM